jgi:endonuclease YncB( thermonuclease family)
VGHLFAYDLPAVRFAPILFAAPLLAASIASAAEPWIISGRVVGVSDGDTITVLDADKKQHQIRIKDIDAPEKGQAARA